MIFALQILLALGFGIWAWVETESAFAGAFFGLAVLAFAEIWRLARAAKSSLPAPIPGPQPNQDRGTRVGRRLPGGEP